MAAKKKTTMIPDIAPSTSSTSPLASIVDDVYNYLARAHGARSKYIREHEAYIATVLNWIVDNADATRAEAWVKMLPATWFTNTIRIVDATPEKIATFAILFIDNKAVSAIMSKDYEKLADMLGGYRWGDMVNAIPFALTIRDSTYIHMCIDADMSFRVVDYIVDRMTADWSLIDEKMIMTHVTCAMILKMASSGAWKEKSDAFILNVIRYGSDRLIRLYIIDAPASLKRVVGIALKRRTDMNMWRHIHYLYARGYHIGRDDKYIIDKRFMDMIIISGAQGEKRKFRADGRVTATPSKNIMAAVRACHVNDDGYVLLPDAQREYMKIVTRIASSFPGDTIIICQEH